MLESVPADMVRIEAGAEDVGNVEKTPMVLVAK